MDDNTLLEYIHRIGRIECSDPDCRACPEHRKDALALIAKYRAEARAEALMEAADRYCKNVCAWPSTEWEHPDECECAQRAAILADEPKAEKDKEAER